MARKKKTHKAREKRPAIEEAAGGSSHRNRPIHIPLDFEKAVIGLMKVKPKKEPPHE